MVASHSQWTSIYRKVEGSVQFNTLAHSTNIEREAVTVPMDERLDELAAVQLVVAVGVVHLEVVKLELLLRHVGGVDRNVHVLLHVPARKR